MEIYLPCELLLFIKGIKKAKLIKSESKYNISKNQLDEIEGNSIVLHLNNQKCMK